MIIGIDGNETNVKKRVGVGRYAYELLRQFYEIRNFKFQIYLKDKPLADLPIETEGWQYKVVKPRKLWTQIGLPFYLYTHFPRPDVFFSPSHYSPRFCPCPKVMSIMDLAYLKFPEMFRKSDLWQLTNWTDTAVKKARRILTISNSSANDIIEYYGVKKEKIVVTYPGFKKEIKIINDINFISKINEQSSINSLPLIIKQKYGITGDYILSVGTLQPRKNYVRLIEAFGRMLEKFQHDELKLVIIGKKGWMWEKILEAPRKFGIEDKVKFLDYVSDEDLPLFYRNAKVFVLVSLYEGFGLPVLEAMSYGCPVLVSKTSSLPEVAGEAGMLVDPKNIEEIKDKLLRLFNLPKNERDEMIRKGKEQAKKFSWEKCASETLKVLEEIGGEKKWLMN